MKNIKLSLNSKLLFFWFKMYSPRYQYKKCVVGRIALKQYIV